MYSLNQKLLFMKRITSLLLAVIVTCSLHAGIISVPLNVTDNSKASMSIIPKDDTEENMRKFIALTPAKVEQLTGKKMGLKEKLALKMAQKHVKKQLQKGKKIDVKDKNQMLRYWLICWGIAIVLTIVGIFVPFVSWIGWLFGLAGSVFFVLWLIAMFAE
jgi:hypothetical protein